MPTEISGSTGVTKIQGGSVTSAKIVDGAITNADINSSAAILASKLGGAIQLFGQSSGDGGSASSNNADILTISNIDLSNHLDRHLIAFGQTSIMEAANTSNVERLRIQLNNGSSEVTLGTTRSGVTHTQVDVGENFLVPISIFVIYKITSAYATTCDLHLNCGIESSTFYYGNSPSYTTHDGEGAGVRMVYCVI